MLLSYKDLECRTNFPFSTGFTLRYDYTERRRTITESSNSMRFGCVPTSTGGDAPTSPEAQLVNARDLDLEKSVQFD
jgi:hypothetical protein